MSDMDLGFAEEREPGWLTNRYFPSKLGGKPAWLELDALPKPEDLQCSKCSGPMSFLCQLYAPYDDEYNFHRTIYVFICRSEACQELNKANNLKVFRSQLPKENSFYPSQPPLECGEPLPAIPAKKKLCVVCGASGPGACGRCKLVNYCSSQHQRAHWPLHKRACSNTTGEGQPPAQEVTFPDVIFPEWEIITDVDGDEDPPKAEDTPDNEQKQIAEYLKLAGEGKTGTLNDLPASELEKYATEQVDDKHFSKFKKEVDKYPEQIIRYKRNGQPLWIANVENTIKEQLDIAHCQLCGGPRQFEFQVMPQMLNLLKDDKVDWGVLAVYTCASSCKLQDAGYATEYIVKQDIIDTNK